MRFHVPLLAIALGAPLPAHAQPVEPAPALVSVETATIGSLLDNPATRAILAEHIPNLTENESFGAWRGLTLRQVQKLVGPSLPDEALDAIQADLDRLPKRQGH